MIMQTSEKMELGMTTEEFAKMLDGRYCGEEITRDEINLAKELGFVVVYGECDDFAVLVGAVNKEIGCYGGGVLECSGLPKPIKSIWCLSSGYCSWMYETELPHSKFRIYSDVKEVYCVGIVCDIGKEVTKSMTHEKVLELLNTIKYCDVDERAKVWAIDVAIASIKELDEVKDMLHAYHHVCAGYNPEHVHDLLQSEKDGRVAVQKAVPGSQVWIMERDECGDPYDISGYMFFASIGNAVIVSPYLSGIKDLEETLDYYIEITAEEYSSDLAVFPSEDCYLTREEAEAALVQKGCEKNA